MRGFLLCAKKGGVKMSKRYVTMEYLLKNVFVNISRGTLYRWVKEGTIPAHKVGKAKNATLLFDLDEVIKAIEKKKEQTK